MSEQHDTGKKRRMPFTARTLKWCAAALLLLALAGLAIWLMQRALRTPARKRAMQSFLDENLNADVALLGNMSVRLNVLRRSRLVFENTEIDHPNPIFSGKFARIGRMDARVFPWAMAGLAPGHADLFLTDAHFLVAENDSGEWSHMGLMKPLAVNDTPFPFPLPKISDWRTEIRDGSVTVVRRGLDLKLGLNGHFDGRPDRDRIDFHADEMPFTFGPSDAAQPKRGSAGPVDLRLLLGRERGDLPLPVAGRCRVDVRGLPAATLPFFVDGLPLDDSPGAFDGVIRYDEHPDAAGTLALEGELVDVPLAIFGLPRQNPLRVVWPVGPKKDNLQAQIHLGPAGFGAFTMDIGLDGAGSPRNLVMRGDVGALDDLPALFTKYSWWPTWLSRTFGSVEWRTGAWRGFGWSGNNLLLTLTRSTAGLNLTGEGEMFGGRVRLSMTPDQHDSPITIAAERLNAEQLAAKLTQMLPEPFRVRLFGAHVNLTWRGFPSADGTIENWGSGLVWAKPVVDLPGSGEWWELMADVSQAIAEELPEWGGGNPAGLLALADVDAMHLDQLSAVAEHGADGTLTVEFRAYGGTFGQATGVVERLRSGAVQGELLLAGPSRLLREVEKANKEFALALELLANDSFGLRVAFHMEPDGELTFHFPFLDDARRVHDEMIGSGAARP